MPGLVAFWTSLQNAVLEPFGPYSPYGAPALGGALKEMQVLREARGWERPSDHAPATILLTL